MMTRSALVSIAVLVGACGDSSRTSEAKAGTEQSKVAGKDACEIMTLADAQEVYGHPMKKSTTNRGFTGPGADVSLCTYENDDVTHIATMMVTWSKTTSGPLASRDAYVTAAEKAMTPELKDALAVEKVEFQGLPSLWQAGQLKVFKEGVMLSILADAAAGKTARETMEALMSKAIPKT